MIVYRLLIFTFLIGSYLFDFVVESLNVSHAKNKLPEEFKFYDQKKYKKSQEYLKENTIFELVSSGIELTATILFIIVGGFLWVDNVARSCGLSVVSTGLIFVAILGLITYVFGLPFSIYRTFILEEKYGFNKTSVKTFVVDIIKGLVLSAILGGIILSFILWFFVNAGSNAWIFAWLSFVIFELFLYFISPVVLMPLFNKFTKLADGALKEKIDTYAMSQHFSFSGIFVMDASRRSSKSNAFFTGIGRFKKIVLFDTLLKNQTDEELVSILAHEIGHYKKRHVIKLLVISIVMAFFVFYVISFFLKSSALPQVFGVTPSVYANLVFVGFLFGPFSQIVGIGTNWLSRKFEREADNFAVTTYKNPKAFASALIKLSLENLSNLTPHPLKVFLEYSHPPVLERIRAIRG